MRIIWWKIKQLFGLGVVRRHYWLTVVGAGGCYCGVGINSTRLTLTNEFVEEVLVHLRAEDKIPDRFILSNITPLDTFFDPKVDAPPVAKQPLVGPVWASIVLAGTVYFGLGQATPATALGAALFVYLCFMAAMVALETT